MVRCSNVLNSCSKAAVDRVRIIQVAIDIITIAIDTWELLILASLLVVAAVVGTIGVVEVAANSSRS